MIVMTRYDDLKESDYYNILKESDWLKETTGNYIKFILVYNREDHNYSIHVSDRRHPDIATLLVEDISPRSKALEEFDYITKHGFVPEKYYKNTRDRKKNKHSKPKKRCKCK
jgi:hypothetical protein